MHGLEWVFSFVLAAVFLSTGLVKAFRYPKAQELLAWVNGLPPGLVKGIGIVEILGALGLILPALSGVSPWLTPMAAIALALLMFMAAMFHAVRRERGEMAVNLLLLTILGVVIYFRWELMP